MADETTRLPADLSDLAARLLSVAKRINPEHAGGAWTNVITVGTEPVRTSTITTPAKGFMMGGIASFSLDSRLADRYEASRLMAEIVCAAVNAEQAVR